MKVIMLTETELSDIIERTVSLALSKITPAPDSSTGNLLTIAQVCAQLQISRATLYRLRRSGKIKFSKVGRTTRIAADQLKGITPN